MTFNNLIIKGREGAGCLEKFADGCNFLARAFWHGHSVHMEKDGEKVSLSSRRGRSCSAWLGKLWGGKGDYLRTFLAMIVSVGYVIACIPVTFLMCIGLAAKRIALAKDNKSKRYQLIAQKYLDFKNKNENKIKKSIDELSKLKEHKSALEDLKQKKEEIGDKLPEGAGILCNFSKKHGEAMHS